MPVSRIFLIDAHALCYRAFFAVKDLRNSKGQPTNAVFGFLNILRKVLKDHAPEHIAVCFDVGKKTKRQERYAEYKIHRPSMPEDLASQIPIIKDIIRAYRIPIFEMEGYEADDVIATLTRRFQGQGHEIVIVTDDKDMYQLIGPGVRIYSSRKDQIIGPEETRERFGVGPKGVVDYLALAGDASDNIPGVDGIGEVTAKNLLQEYGSLDNILKNADKLKGKLKDKIAGGREVALLSKELATLHAEVPLECSLEDIRVKDLDREAMAKIFTELEFKGFLAELETTAQGSATSVDIGEISADAGQLAQEAGRIARIAVFFSFAQQDGAQVLDEIFVCAGGAVYRFPASGIKTLKPLFENKKIAKTLYGVKEIRKALLAGEVALEGEVFDAFLAAYLLLAGQTSYGIDALAWAYLKRGISDENSAGHSVKALFDLDEPLRKDLAAKGADTLYQDIEFPLSLVLSEMEHEGVRVDLELLSELSKACEKKIAGMTQELYALAGGEFNLNSPKQLGVVLFEKLKLPVGRKTKTGYSTDEEVLTRLASQHKLPAMILEYRQLAKLKSTYIDALPKLVNPRTGRIHCSFNQTGAETGRLSSNHPNLQNIPVRTEMGREIRKAFVPSAKGRVLVSADYSQIELRVLAHLANEPNLKKAFADGEDIHNYTAALMFDVAQKDVTTEMRYSAKRINFGITYGMSAFGLAKDLGVAQKEAQSFIDRYFLRYPGIKTFMEQEIDKARSQGYIETMFHRRRYLPDINSKNPAVRQFAERQAVNTPVQGAAADLIKIAMVRVGAELKKAKLGSRMIITVHDELVFDAPKEELNTLVKLVKETLENAVSISVPLVVTVKCGANWAEMDKV